LFVTPEASLSVEPECGGGLLLLRHITPLPRRDVVYFYSGVLTVQIAVLLLGVQRKWRRCEDQIDSILDGLKDLRRTQEILGFSVQTETQICAVSQGFRGTSFLGLCAHQFVLKVDTQGYPSTTWTRVNYRKAKTGDATRP